jgi:hypothetical protein
VKREARSQLKCAFPSCGGLAVENRAVAGASALGRRLDIIEEKTTLIHSFQTEQENAADGGVCAFLICLRRLCGTMLRRADGEVDRKGYREPGPASSGRLTEYIVSDLGVIGELSPAISVTIPSMNGTFYEASRFCLGCVPALRGFS